MTTPGTLNGIVYITRADYLTLKNAGSTGAVIGTSTDKQYYDINKVYIIKEELAPEVSATAAATYAEVPPSTPAVWAAILSASGANYKISYVTPTTGTYNNYIRLESTCSEKDASKWDIVTYNSSDHSGISTAWTYNSDLLDGHEGSYYLDLSNAADGSLINSKIADGTITNAKLATVVSVSTTVSSNTGLARWDAICAWAKNYTDSNEKSYTFANGTTSDIVKITPYTGTTAGSVCSITINNVKSAQTVNSIGIQTGNGTTIFVDGATGNTIATASAITNYVNQRLTRVYIYKGSKDTYADLPKTGQVIGDVWNVIAEYNNGDIHYAAGTNFAWNENDWDPLGGEDKLTANTAADNVVSFSVGNIGYSKTINNVAHAETATNATYAANVSNGTTNLAAQQIINALTITYLV